MKKQRLGLPQLGFGVGLRSVRGTSAAAIHESSSGTPEYQFPAW
jgi:hypothetical protein